MENNPLLGEPDWKHSHSQSACLLRTVGACTAMLVVHSCTGPHLFAQGSSLKFTQTFRLPCLLPLLNVAVIPLNEVVLGLVMKGYGPLSTETLVNHSLLGGSAGCRGAPSVPHNIYVDNIGIIRLDPGFVGSAQVELVSRFNTAGLRVHEVKMHKSSAELLGVHLTWSNTKPTSPIRGTGRCGLDSRHCHAEFYAPVMLGGDHRTLHVPRSCTTWLLCKKLAQQCGPRCVGSSKQFYTPAMRVKKFGSLVTSTWNSREFRQTCSVREKNTLSSCPRNTSTPTRMRSRSGIYIFGSGQRRGSCGVCRLRL